MYVAVTLWLSGLAFLVDDLWIFVGALVSMLIVHSASVLPEETYLEERFGDAYRGYKSRVRRYL